MHRFRSIWLALVGGAFIVTLSLSVALGADPADETDGNRGQTISGFVHSLIFDQDDPARCLGLGGAHESRAHRRVQAGVSDDHQPDAGQRRLGEPVPHLGSEGLLGRSAREVHRHGVW